MTHTLLLRLEGLTQSWGHHSRFTDRDTNTRPTKSAVIGLLAAADGHDRDEHRPKSEDFLPLETLTRLRFGVRADRPGSLVQDFHTVGGGQYPLRPRNIITDPHRAARAAPALENATGHTFTRHAAESLRDWYGAPKNIAPDLTTNALTAGNTHRHPITSTRWYLADAAFLAGVESHEPALLHHLAQRLDKPRRLLWLGRKSCPPSHHINAGIYPGTLENALTHTNLLPRAPHTNCTAWFEVPPHTPGAIQTNDQPLTFSSHTRSHAPRWEQRVTLTPPTGANP